MFRVQKLKNNTPPRLSKMTYEEKFHNILFILLGILYKDQMVGTLSNHLDHHLGGQR